jgi:beta-barrel assembly-enhancing protease
MGLPARVTAHSAAIVLLLFLTARFASAQSVIQPTMQAPAGIVGAVATDPAPPSASEEATDFKNSSRTHKAKAKYDISKIGKRSIGKGLDFYSAEEERKLGQELARAIEGSATVVNDPVINEYVNRLGQQLVRNSDARSPFVVKVLDYDEINAYALPGGFLFVNRGLILAADNEAQLTGAMAHEIAHVAARHATRSVTRAQIIDGLSLSLIFITGPFGLAAHGLAMVSRPLAFRKFSRNAEREADLLGLEYQHAAGYDPQEFVALFESLGAGEEKQRSFLVKAFATHPMTSDRIKLAQEEITTYLPGHQQYVVDTSEFQDIKARLKAVTQGMPKLRGESELHPSRRIELERR